MRRREFIALFSSAAMLPQVARAQPRPLPLIGILAPDRPPFAGYDAFLESLRGLGQIELTHLLATANNLGSYMGGTTDLPAAPIACLGMTQLTHWPPNFAVMHHRRRLRM